MGMFLTILFVIFVGWIYLKSCGEAFFTILDWVDAKKHQTKKTEEKTKENKSKQNHKHMKYHL